LEITETFLQRDRLWYRAAVCGDTSVLREAHVGVFHALM
jgi:hypothetical protein